MKASKRSKKYQPPKKKMRRRNIVILWVVAIGLLVSMVISFTPMVGYFPGQHTLNEPAFYINDEPIMELDIARSRQSQLFTITEGEVAEDAELLLLSQLIDNEVLRQAAEGTRVGRGEVSEAIREYREARGVLGGSNDTQYLQLIANQGFTDQAFRDFQREQIRQRKFIDSLVEDIEVTDDEVRDFYEANKFNYLSDPQIVARQIVLDDEDLANTLLVRIARGEDFEVLASEYSLELAEVGGAISADDDGNPQPIGRIGLPTSVASAALGLEGRGTTDVISTGGRFHIVKVEEYLARTVQAFEDIETEIREATLAAKETAVLQDALEQLRDQANIEFPPSSTYDYTDEVVATVGDSNIYELDLAEATYLNQQVQQFLSPETADTIVSFFKPTYLEQLIEQHLALQGARSLDANFVGSDALIASSALNYIANDVDPSEADLEDYYNTNVARFTIPASATVVQLDFDTQDAAGEFRDTILTETLDFAGLAERASSEALIYNDLGNVSPGQLESELDRYLFGTEAFEAINDEGLLEVSDVIVIETDVEVPVSPEDISDDTDASAPNTEDSDSTLDASSETPDASDDDTPSEDTVDDTASDDSASTDSTDSDEEPAPDSADATSDTSSAEAPEPETQLITETTYTLLVAIRTPERVRSLDDVRSQVEEAVLATQRSETQQNWLTALRETIPVNNLITEEPAVLTPSTPNVEFTTEPVEGTSEDVSPDETSPDETDDTGEASDAADAADTPEESTSEESTSEASDTGDDAVGEDTSEESNAVSSDEAEDDAEDDAAEDATMDEADDTSSDTTSTDDDTSSDDTGDDAVGEDTESDDSP